MQMSHWKLSVYVECLLFRALLVLAGAQACAVVADDHVVQLPGDRAWGFYEIVDADADWTGETLAKLNNNKSPEFKSEIVVPANKKLLIAFFDQQASSRPKSPARLSILNRFDQNDVLALVTPFSLITAEQVAHLQRHKSLRYLSLGPLSQVDDEAFAAVTKLKSLEALAVPETKITDAGLRHVAALERLELLILYGTKITDEGLEHLRSLSHLRTLELGRTAVSDEGLRHLSELQELETLDLKYTQVSNDGLKYLIGLKSLATLNLRRTGVTGAGLPQLASLGKLKTIYIDRDQITNEEQQAFSQVSPNVETLITQAPPPRNAEQRERGKDAGDRDQPQEGRDGR